MSLGKGQTPSTQDIHQWLCSLSSSSSTLALLPQLLQSPALAINAQMPLRVLSVDTQTHTHTHTHTNTHSHAPICLLGGGGWGLLYITGPRKCHIIPHTHTHTHTTTPTHHPPHTHTHHT